MAVINLQQLVTEQANDIKKYQIDAVLKAPELTVFSTVYPNVLAKKQIGFIGDMGYIMTKHTGCGTQTTGTLNTRTVEFDPQSWFVNIPECYSNLENTAAQYAMKKGADVADLTGTDFAAIVSERMAASLKNNVIALAVYGDTQSQDAHLSIFDGVLKQMETQATVVPAQKIQLSANNIIAGVMSMIQAAPVELRADASAKIFASQKVYDAILAGLVSANASNLAWAGLVDGVQTVKILGVEVVAMPSFDKAALVAGKQDAIAFYTAPKYIGIATDIETFGDVKVVYDAASDYNYFKSAGKLDAKLLNPEMFVLGTL